MKEYIAHRHQTSGQSVQMFYNWMKDFTEQMNNSDMFKKPGTFKIHIPASKQQLPSSVQIKHKLVVRAGSNSFADLL